MRKTFLALGALLLLGACAAQIDRIGGRVAQERMQYNDAKARALVLAVCDMAVGSKNRVLSEADRARVEGLCGGAPPLTLGDLSGLIEIYRALRGAAGAAAAAP